MPKTLKEMWPPALIVLLLCVGLLQAGLAPIYPDEIAYKIFFERYFISGGYKQSVTPFCDNFLMRPGLALLPAAWFWSGISWLGSGWFSYRLVPYAGLGAIFVVLARTNIRHGNRNFLPLLLPITMGPALYGLLLLRPEITILTLCAILYALAELMLAMHRARDLYTYALAVLLVFCLAVYIHPKALYLLATVGTLAFATSSNLQKPLQRVTYLAGFMLGAVLITLTALKLLVPQFLECKSLPVIEQKIERIMGLQAVNPLDLVNNREQFLTAMTLAIKSRLWRDTINRFEYQNEYQINYLPAKDSLSWFDMAANTGIIAIFVILLLYITTKSRACFLQLTEPTEKKRFALVFSIAAALFIPFLLNLTRAFYDESFLFGSILIVAGLLRSFKVPRYDGDIPFARKLFHVLAIGISALCLLCSYFDFTVPLLQGYQGPSLSYKTDKEKIGEEIQRALDAAAVLPADSLIVDDLTYDAVREHPIVLPVTYLLIAERAAKGAMNMYAEKYHASFGIIRCSILNQEIKKVVSFKTLAVLDYTPPMNGDAPDGVCLFRFM